MFLSMDAAHDIAGFLTSRRARVTPEQAGLPIWGQRRVKGLRREELASLAGVSVEYYTRLERGNARNPYDRGLSDLVGELSTRSPEFGAWWAAHNVRNHRTGTKRSRDLLASWTATAEPAAAPVDE